ncbi:MAG: rod shape-determining protein MreC [Lachnospiraceae bacterium]|nr:rod shape-determining protein MreC [Lachnospiraceae bacterium]
MSPVVKKKGEKFTLPSKYLLFILTILCVSLLVVTYATDVFNRPLNYVVSYVIVPYQKGISAIGAAIGARKDELVNIRDLMAENAELRTQINELEEENNRLMQDKYELVTLRNLFELNEVYENYEKTGAHIIYKDSGNWFSTFIINKGSNDGIALDMNVISGKGLVGRINMVGPNWSRVSSIISDTSNVSGKVLSTSDNLIVSGSLEQIDKGVISFSQLIDENGKVTEGDKVVTSDISDKYLPGILIGYISEVNNDPNNLTKSGLLIPAVDFKHIEEVLIITKVKPQITKEDMDEAVTPGSVNE